MQSVISTLLIDVGNVILFAKESITYEILEEYGVARMNAESMYSNDAYSDFERGRMDGKTFARLLKEKYLKFPLTDDAIVRAHDAHIYGVDTEVVKVLEQLPHLRTVIVTDTNVWQTAREKQLIDLNRYAERTFRSNEVGMLKIDPGFFPHVFKELGVSPGETLLVDDSPSKIQAAANVGANTLLFESAQQLSEGLKQREILT